MSQHYIDFLFRVKVEVPEDVNTEHVAEGLRREFTLPAELGVVEDSEQLDSRYAGACDETIGALIRHEDNASGRDAWICHDPDDDEDEDQ